MVLFTFSFASWYWLFLPMHFVVMQDLFRLHLHLNLSISYAYVWIQMRFFIHVAETQNLNTYVNSGEFILTHMQKYGKQNAQRASNSWKLLLRLWFILFFFVFFFRKEKQIFILFDFFRGRFYANHIRYVCRLTTKKK